MKHLRSLKPTQRSAKPNLKKNLALSNRNIFSQIEEEEKKKAAIANMSLHYGGYLARAEKNKPNKRQSDREKKKKFLADRRKPLNIDHLNSEKLQEKAQELWDWLFTLEEEKYDFEQRIDRQKYDINQLRQRVNEYMGKFSKNKRQTTGKMNIGGGVAARSGAFKWFELIGIYRVSIKSLYNLKKLLQSEMMRYRNEVCFMLICIS